LWFVTSRGEVRCLDTEGFHDGENDGPYTAEASSDKDEADVIWVLDMMKDLGVSQHNMCSCSLTAIGDILFVCTSNGVDESHINLPAPHAPSFMAVDKNTGKVLWTDASPGDNILHGQWSSPAYSVLGGTPQVMFAGGDAWLYSFLGETSEDGKAKLLWKFDANPKESKYILGGRGTRNEVIGTPLIYDDLVYLAVGQDPEHGEGVGHLWCIDPTKRGDVSSELAFNVKDLKTPIAPHRMQAVVKENGEVAKPNPNSAVVWHYSEYDQNGDGKVEFEETMHRTCGTAAIKNGLLIIPDFSGLVHCVDAKTGKPHWTHDLFAATWGSALIVEDKVYVGDEEGKVTIFKLSPEKEIIAEIDMGNSVYSTPVVANNILYIANKTHVFAIKADE
jgi:outer membrane protein assembly factor BamB